MLRRETSISIFECMCEDYRLAWLIVLWLYPNTKKSLHVVVVLHLEDISIAAARIYYTALSKEMSPLIFCWRILLRPLALKDINRQRVLHTLLSIGSILDFPQIHDMYTGQLVPLFHSGPTYPGNNGLEPLHQTGYHLGGEFSAQDT